MYTDIKIIFFLIFFPLFVITGLLISRDINVYDTIERNIRIEKSYLINLPNRTDKWKNMQKSLKSIPNLERIDGVIKDPPSYVKISKGQYGCTLAHLNVLRKIANFPETDQIDPNIELWYLVFEDDIEPLHGIDSFNEKVNNAIKFLPSTANIINMGMSSKIFEGYNMVSGYLNQNKYLKGFRFCTQSYGCTPAGARAMIKAIENNKFSNAIDVVLNRTYMNSDRAFFIWLTIQNRGKDSESDIKRIDNYKM